MKFIQTPNRPQASTGSPEAYVRGFTDLQLQDKEFVSNLTRGLGWDREPERFLAAAKHELEWRRENGVMFGWVRIR